MTTSAALEAHRRTNGQFGEQPAADAGQLDLGADAWVEDGVTPHPTGGYVRVVEGDYSTQYLDMDGEPHREDGPAVTRPRGGEQEWFRHGVRHRLDGPAFVTDGGREEWFRDGAHHREGGPAMVSPGLYEGWAVNGKFHRVDGPAFTSPDGTLSWYRDGVWHREDGPAIVHPNGRKEWWLNGQRVDGRTFRTGTR